MTALGLNYRLSDINCALAKSQLGKLEQFAARRRRLAACYDAQLAGFAPLLRPITRSAHCVPAWHLYSVLIDFEALGTTRGQLMRVLEERGVRTQVHYIPVHRHPYYRDRYGTVSLPGAESYYRRTLSLPLFVGMDEEDVDYVVETLRDALGFGAAAVRGRVP
jgi:dTDP-4-amino-4,6-dideoxygalactose transaminase